MLPKKKSYEQFEALCREVLSYYYNKNLSFMVEMDNCSME